MKKYFVYIIYSVKYDLYYIGSTSNLEDRLRRHNSDRSIFTRGKGPWEIIISKEFPSKSDAYRCELKLKSLKNSKFAIDYLRNLV
ncbi:MAG: GIY-YIG nuclease family protein [Ignavibacteriaceae bacterium]